MKKVAIIGAGPTGIYTLLALVKSTPPLAISIYEQAREAGIGMPYSNEENSRMMLANIASIEIPPVISSYIDWLRRLSESRLARYGVERSSLHIRQFLPRILLGEYFRDQFLQLVAQAKQRGFTVEVHESCQVTDLKATLEGAQLWTRGLPVAEHFDLAVIATGHVWPEESESTPTFFPSPWSGLMEARIPPCKVGILGTSLSGIDAAMAVVIQHGEFVQTDDGHLKFLLDEGSEGLEIALMSRSGILPEADFYCPLPYEPLSIVTAQAVEKEITAGSEGLLDRIFRLMAEELELADPPWSRLIGLSTLDADSFAHAWFADRRKNDPFRWAYANLIEVERNKHDRRTVPWRYAILRLHEAVQDIVPYLNEEDSKRFHAGIARVFIDNYAAIPSESIRRLLALREAGLITILALGQDYKMDVEESQTSIAAEGKSRRFDVFIDARGQKPLQTRDLPFTSLRHQLEACGDEIPDIGDDYTLLSPECARGHIAFGALPYLMHDQPFVQGLTECAAIGAAIAKAMAEQPSRTRRRLRWNEL